MEDFARYLAAHHGVFTRAQARRFGLTDRQVDWRYRVGDYVRMAPRTFRLATAPVTWEAGARAAALSVRGLVHCTGALAVWGVDGHRRDGDLAVVVDRSRRPRSAPAAIHRVDMSRVEGRLVDGIPVTTCARAVVDSASVLSRTRLELTIDAVVRQRLATIGELVDEVERLGTQGRKGLGVLDRLLVDRDVPAPVPDSGFNRLVGQLLVAAGLPRPAYEWQIRNGGRFVARADLAYPDARLAIECDSERWHRDRQSFVADPRRKNRMMVAGYRVLTFTWADYTTQPDAVVATVAGVLDKTDLRFGPSATPDVA